MLKGKDSSCLQNGQKKKDVAVGERAQRVRVVFIPMLKNIENTRRHRLVVLLQRKGKAKRGTKYSYTTNNLVLGSRFAWEAAGGGPNEG